MRPLHQAHNRDDDQNPNPNGAGSLLENQPPLPPLVRGVKKGAAPPPLWWRVLLFLAPLTRGGRGGCRYPLRREAFSPTPYRNFQRISPVKSVRIRSLSERTALSDILSTCFSRREIADFLT